MYWQILGSHKALKKPPLICLVKGHLRCNCSYYLNEKLRCATWNIPYKHTHCNQCGWIELNSGNWVKVASKLVTNEGLDMRHPEPYCGYFVIVYRKDVKDDITYYVEAGSNKEAISLVREMVEQTVTRKEYKVLKCNKNI
jgi:hypothetical protein